MLPDKVDTLYTRCNRNLNNRHMPFVDAIVVCEHGRSASYIVRSETGNLTVIPEYSI